MTKSTLLMLKVGILMVNLLIATLFFTAIIPPLTGGISVELPDGGSLNWEVYGHNIAINTSVKIINRAYYSIDATKIWIDITDGPLLILNKTVEIPSIKGGSEITEPISLVFDMDEIRSRGGEDLIFSDAEIKINVNVVAFYTFNTIKFAAEYTDIYPWEALVKEMSIDLQNATYESGANGLTVTIPYVVETSSLLSGKTAEVELILDNETGEITRDYETVNLGYRTTGDITFVISSNKMNDLLTRSQRLNIHATINLAGEEIEEDYSYNWGAPLNNLTISEPSLSGSSVYTSFSFNNDMDRNLDIRILTEVFDSSDSQIGYGSDSFGVSPGEYISRSVETDISGIPSYARITVEDLNSGLQYSIIRGVN